MILMRKSFMSHLSRDGPSGRSDRAVCIVYDGECPFCSAYVRLVRLRDIFGEVHLVNARHGGPLVEELIAANLNLDEGMILKWEGKYYHGSDCIHMLALMTTPSTMFNRLNIIIFSSPVLARFLYPLLRAGRNAILRILGRSKINQTVTSASPR